MHRFAPRCLSIDLEVGVPDTRIHRFGAVRGDKASASMHFKQGKLLAALEQLDALADGATLRLVKAYGGTRIYVPKHFDPTHPLAALIGPAHLVTLVEAYRGDRFDIPRAHIAIKALRDKQIRAERLGGVTHARLALKHQLTERQIRNILGPESVAEAERQRRQPQLF